ncbi:DUF4158 domain-containing protein [Enterobacter cloacae]|uniref:DUF4158 domain-containing protein n=1 Tax=Enterobacter cloacae TaxID=550 RepID=UPI00388ED761
MISLSPPTICNSAPPHGRLTHAASLDPSGHGAGHPLALPESRDDLIRYYTFNDSDLSLIRQRRGDANRLGFAVQFLLAALPRLRAGNRQRAARAGHPVGGEASPCRAGELGNSMAKRDVTRREHARNCAPTCNWPCSACPTSAPRCAS